MKKGALSWPSTLVKGFPGDELLGQAGPVAFVVVLGLFAQGLVGIHAADVRGSHGGGGRMGSLVSLGHGGPFVSGEVGAKDHLGGRPS